MKEEDDQTPNRSWNLMIGISMTILGSFQLYNRLQEESDISFGVIFTVFFILFGLYLIFRHFQNPSKD